MITTATNTDTPPVTLLPDDQRARIVTTLLDAVYAATIDKGTAALVLDITGLTGNSDHISHALAARYMRDGLADGSISVNDVDPSFTVNRDIARQVLIEEYQRELDESVTALAAVRVAS